MSRYEKNLGDDTLSVGWDAPMNTYFAQVSVNQADDDLRDLPLKLWFGGKFDEFADFPVFVEKLAENGYKLEKTIEIQLRRDRLIGSDPLAEEVLEADGWTKKQ